MTPLNRRRFLKAAGAGVGTLALGPDRLFAGQRSAAEPTAEIVVVGAGAFGGWTALYLREMGLSVTMVDQYGPGNSRATSGGESRQIRAGYGERELYTRWVLQAFERWKAREAEHFIVSQHPELKNVWLVGGGSGHGYKHGIMLGDYVANRVVGKDKSPELAATFKLKDQTF